MLFDAAVEQSNEVFAEVHHFQLVETVLENLFEVPRIWLFSVFVVDIHPGRLPTSVSFTGLLKSTILLLLRSSHTGYEAAL